MLDWPLLTDEVFVGSFLALLWDLILWHITVLWLWLLRFTSICCCCCHRQHESVRREELGGVKEELQIRTRGAKGRVKMNEWKQKAKCKIYESTKEEVGSSGITFKKIHMRKNNGGGGSDNWWGFLLGMLLWWVILNILLRKTRREQEGMVYLGRWEARFAVPFMHVWPPISSPLPIVSVLIIIKLIAQPMKRFHPSSLMLQGIFPF